MNENNQIDNKKKMSNKKRTAIAVSLLLVLALVLGTFSWFTSDHDVRNIFKMDTFYVNIVEDFDSEIPAIPGGEYNKNVIATNFGNVPALVRVKVNEEFQFAVVENNLGDSGTGEVLYEKIDDVNNFDIDEDLEEYQIVATYTLDSIKQTIGSNYTNVVMPSGADVNDPSKAVGRYAYMKEFTGNNGNIRTEYYAFEVAKTGKQDASGDDILVYRQMEFDLDKTNNPATEVWKYMVYKMDPARNYKGEHKPQHEDLVIGTDPFDVHNGVITVTDGSIGYINDADGTIVNANPSYSNTPEWVYFHGYFYYIKPLEGGASTDKLIQKVAFDKDLGNEYKGSRYIIHPFIESVQASKDAADAEWDASTTLGMTVNGSTITSYADVYALFGYTGLN